MAHENSEILISLLGRSIEDSEVKKHIEQNNGAKPVFRDNEGDIDNSSFRQFIEQEYELRFDRPDSGTPPGAD